MNDGKFKAELLATFDRWKPYMTPDQIAAVSLVLFASDQIPSKEAMARFSRLASFVGAVTVAVVIPDLDDLPPLHFSQMPG